MSLNHLEELARLAGYAAVPDEDDAPEPVSHRATLTQRLMTPDAPEPRAATAIVPVAQAGVAGSAAPARVALTSYVSGALRTAQGMIGSRSATA
jgi:hypothetical protein